MDLVAEEPLTGRRGRGADGAAWDGVPADVDLLVQYRLGDWVDDDRDRLTDALVAMRVAHRWDGHTLAVPPPEEAIVDVLVERVDASHDTVEYDLSDWTHAQREALGARLVGAVPAAFWDADQHLVVPRSHEAIVDDLIDEVDEADDPEDLVADLALGEDDLDEIGGAAGSPPPEDQVLLSPPITSWRPDGTWGGAGDT